jgi:hypothetical protein
VGADLDAVDNDRSGADPHVFMQDNADARLFLMHHRHVGPA